VGFSSDGGATSMAAVVAELRSTRCLRFVLPIAPSASRS
jgi:hypothetical protein